MTTLRSPSYLPKLYGATAAGASLLAALHGPLPVARLESAMFDPPRPVDRPPTAGMPEEPADRIESA